VTDPYIIADPTNVTGQSIRSYVMGSTQRVYFQWDVGDRAGAWIIGTDATPTAHDFDLYGRNDQSNGWNDADISRDGDESITVNVQAGGYIYIRVYKWDAGTPTDLTLTIEPPAATPSVTPTVEPTATATPEPTPTATPIPVPTATPTPEPTPTATATLAAPSFTSGGSGTVSDPYIIADPTNVTGHSIHSYVAGLATHGSVRFRWNVGDRAGAWNISIDAIPTSHDFDLYGRNDQSNGWNDTDTSWDGDESITINVHEGGYIYIRVYKWDAGTPTDLTLTIEPPSDD
jgi:hypothetical protein